MLDILHPKVHLLVGGIIYVLAIYLSSLTTNYYLFLLSYAVVGGIGYGIIYMLPLKNAYLFFPKKKGLVGGMILSCASAGAMVWC
jgi:MFS family permease